MTDPTSILEQTRRRGVVKEGRNAVTTATRRGACVLALVLLFLTTGVGSMPNLVTGSQGLEFQAASKPAQAETLTNRGNYSEGLLSASTRHKTH
jgi:hypothetical protein